MPVKRVVEYALIATILLTLWALAVSFLPPMGSWITGDQ
jgi:hypothetical protein